MTTTEDNAGAGKGRRSDSRGIITDLRFPDMQDLAEHLYFNPREGLIWLGEKRMLLVHAEAFGALRQELLESMGVEFTRGLFTRTGYLTGIRDAELAIRTRNSGTQLDILAAGAQLHALSGMVEVIPVCVEFDQSKGYLYGEFIWKHSVESDLHVASNGGSSDPICWMEVGYSSGFLTRLMGKRILVRETECRAAGDEVCRAIARPVEEWEDAEEDLKYFQPRAADHRRGEPASPPAPKSDPLSLVAAPFGLTQPRSSQPELDRPVGSSAAYHAALHKILGGGNYISAVVADELVLHARNENDRPVHERLSDREYQVLCLIGAGKAVNEISSELALSPSTISTYRARILQKMNMTTNAQLMQYAIQNGLVMRS